MAENNELGDDLLIAAFALYNNPGAYALLLGSGVSAPSGVPTAWGVLEDLVAKAADIAGFETTDPMRWYADTYGEAPTYEGVLKKIAPTPFERQSALKGYFEPTAEEVQNHRKEPTEAHRSIARLVADGAVRVIVTLNFDHLIETALRQEGIEPTIIATPGDIAGMAPLHTHRCCVVHLHGDYLNPTSMRNTTEELAGYEPATNVLLQQIVGEYGLVIAGWSSTYDPVVRDAIAEHYTSRYTMTWMEPFEESEQARRLRTLKQGVLIVSDADNGFGRLADGVRSLRTRRARHPLTVAVAVETAKRELSGQSVAIGVHDTLRGELAKLHGIDELHPTDYGSADVYGGYESLLERVEEASRLPAGLVATLAYWGSTETDKWWLDEVPRFATRAFASGETRLLDVRTVPGVALFHAAGVAAVAAQRFDLLCRLFSLKQPDPTGQLEPLAARLAPTTAYGNSGFSASTRAHSVVAPLVTDALALGGEALDDAWQIFEILRLAWLIVHHEKFGSNINQIIELDKKIGTLKVEATLVNADPSVTGKALSEVEGDRSAVIDAIGRLAPVWGPRILVSSTFGRNGWRSHVADRLIDDLRLEGEEHPLITAGLAARSMWLRTACEALSIQFGREASHIAFSTMSPFVPPEIWLDTGAPPQPAADPITP